jgi:hypothetical protein
MILPVFFCLVFLFVCVCVCLPLGNATLEADTIEGATDRNRQPTVLVPLKEFLGFFFVCRPGRCGKLLRGRIYIAQGVFLFHFFRVLLFPIKFKSQRICFFKSSDRERGKQLRICDEILGNRTIGEKLKQATISPAEHFVLFLF